ncbi:MAG: hypothetical protein IJ189_07515 [Clostridia bacterium]|nr:hypothetical protein [Clostridia bacterium]
MSDEIIGNFQYCYNGIPVIRGYCSSKTLIKYSQPHPAYQRKAETNHVEEIKEFLKGYSLKFMPEVILSYDYSGMYSDQLSWKAHMYTTPFDYLSTSTESGMLKVWDSAKAIEFARIKKDEVNTTIKIKINYGNPLLDPHQVFNRIDGNHRMEALEDTEEDYLIPYCIILLKSSGNPMFHDREKLEMEIFHNINSKVQPLTLIEQYRGLFGLFTPDELAVYGKEYSLTKQYIEKYRSLPFKNIFSFFSDLEDIILFCFKFMLDREEKMTEDDLSYIFNVLEHTYFNDYEVIRSCKNRFAIIPYVYYCYMGEKHENAKLTAYNTWFINSRLYDVKDFDPASMIDVFDSIYEIRKKQIFVAMPFKDELKFVYDAICDTVNKINSDHRIDLPIPVRIDKQITGFSYDIINEMLNQIENAGLLIADLTEENANVYYEAGFAQGLIRAKLGNAVQILYLVSNPENPDLPFDEVKFDIKHYKMIPYKNAGNGVAELKKNLEKELKAFYQL